MEQNTISSSNLERKRRAQWWLLSMLTVFLVAAADVYGPHPIAQSTPIDPALKSSAPNVAKGTPTPQQAESPTPKKPEYPAMYNLGFRCPEFWKIRDSLTYKPHEPGALDSNLQLIWGNGRFRMMYDALTVENPDNLPGKFRGARYYGLSFEDSSGYKDIPRVFTDTCVTKDVQRIRYVKGILYCMGKDAYVAVDIQKETWDVFSDTDKAPSPHKEEFAKLKEYDKDNLIWTGETIMPKSRWIAEPKPEPVPEKK